MFWLKRMPGLLEETQEMKRQLETRKLVERAKGILQHRYKLSEEEHICVFGTKAAAFAGR